jgi:hypothetical protein
MPEQAGLPQAWPFPVQQPIREILEWRTDVLQSREAEQRIALRPVPREIVTYAHVLDAAGITRATELVRAGFTTEWLVPLWSMTSRPGVDLVETDLVIPMDTSLGDWRGPGHAVVATDGGEAHAIEVAAVFPDRLELASPVGVALADVLVAPAQRAILTAPVEITRRRQSLGTVTASFTLRDGADLGATPYPSHLGLDVLTEPTVLRQPLAESVSQAVEMVDNGFGPLAIEPVRDYLQRRSSITLVDYGAEARWTRRRWLHSLRGRQRAFWLPTWGRELVLQEPLTAASTSMVVGPIADPGSLVGRQVMFDLPAGPIFREITGAAFDALGHRLDIAAPGVLVPAETPVHFLTRVRLDADRIELEHTATRTEMSVAVIEVPA